MPQSFDQKHFQAELLSNAQPGGNQDRFNPNDAISRRRSLQRLACIGSTAVLSTSNWGLLANANQANDEASSDVNTSHSAALEEVTVSKEAPDIKAELEQLRLQAGLPSLMTGLVRKDGTLHIEHCGYRNSQTLQPILHNDSMHLGSCTKSMTATLVAIFVEEGKISWDTTLGELCRNVFPNGSNSEHTSSQTEASSQKVSLEQSEWGKITVQQIIEHTAALPANAPWAFWLDRHDIVKAREEVAAWLLSQTPDPKLIGTYHYSNVGYMLLGHFLERLENKPWEELITERLFQPLKMSSAGFGSPAELPDGRENWGHFPSTDRDTLLASTKDKTELELRKLWTPTNGDNPEVLGPAGTVHASMQDWAKYLRVQLLSPSEPSFPLPIGQANWNHLHQPRQGSNYAGGWVVEDRSWADGPTYFHNGSNTMWYCITFVAPRKGVAVFAATNCGLEAANAVDQSLQLVLKRWL